MTTKKLFFTLFFLLLLSFNAFSQDESFELATVPSYWTTTNGTLNTSTDHYKSGLQSLKWDWTANAEITVTNLQSHGLVPSEILNSAKPFFRMWSYNTASIPNGNLQIEFYDNNGIKQFYYSFGVNFTGWRAATANYSNEMSGNKASTNITTMKIKAPTSGSGTLYFDYVDFSGNAVSQRAPDYQMPYIVKSGGDLHWIQMMDYQKLDKTFSAIPPTNEEKSDLAAVKAQYDAMIATYSSISVSNAITKYNALGITNVGDIIKGKPLFGKDNPDTENLDVVDYFILAFAKDYKNNNTATSKDYFLNTVRYLLDQGYADGSLMETLHHVGYSFTGIPFAIHLMESELRNANLWDQAQKMVEWYSAVDVIWDPKAANSDMDDGHTRALPILGACLYKNTDAERVQYLKGYKQYIENFFTLRPQPSEGMKIDFTGFHHNTYYPGYTFLAYNDLAKAINYISQGAYSSFAISVDARNKVKKALLLARVIAEGGNIPNSLSGRNPFQYPKFSDGLKYLGLANPVDADILKAHNYIYGTTSGTSLYGTETPPVGFWQVNFANLGTYRQSNWVANIKGFNKYFWGSEIYASENRYGRYQSYGAIEIMYKGGASNSKFNISGWDWNKIPGTTTKYLTNTNLVAATARQDEKTDSNFVASLRFQTKDVDYIDQTIEGQYGMFGMDFTQKKISPTHDPNFKFKKSVFCFDGKLICLGSNITTTDGLIATNLFQNYLSSTSANSTTIDNLKVTTFPYNNSALSISSNHWIIDAAGTGYFIKSGNTIIIDRKNQTSPSETGGTTTTSGNFASAYISHGTPTSGNGSYEYVIIPGTTSADMATFSANMSNSDTAFYQVIQKDQTAHIVKCNDMYGYSLFESGNYGTSTPVLSNDAPCLIMTKQTENNLTVSIVNPDLNFAANNGISQTKTITIIINGVWTLDNSSGGLVSASSSNSKTTTLTVQAKDGLAVDLSLSPVQVSDDSNKGIAVFPNPTKGILNITKTDTSIQIKNVSVFNIIGKLIYTQKSDLPIDVSNFANGVYLIKIETDKKETFKTKIIVN